MLFLLALPPSDLEILYAAVDSACKGRCVLSANTLFSGANVPEAMYDYLRLRYTDTTLTCTTRVNVVDARVVYRKTFWNVKRTASFRAIVSGCGFTGEVFGTYDDHVSASDINAVRVPGISPSEIPTGGPMEILVSAAVVFGILYAFYTIEGR